MFKCSNVYTYVNLSFKGKAWINWESLLFVLRGYFCFPNNLILKNLNNKIELLFTCDLLNERFYILFVHFLRNILLTYFNSCFSKLCFLRVKIKKYQLCSRTTNWLRKLLHCKRESWRWQGGNWFMNVLENTARKNCNKKNAT